MAFHGYTERDIQYGRNMADQSVEQINDDATATELAHVETRFYGTYGGSIFPGIEMHEERNAIRKINTQAMAQLVIARELGLQDDIRDYGAVVAKTNQDLDIVSHRDPLRLMTDEQKNAYKALLDKA